MVGGFVAVRDGIAAFEEEYNRQTVINTIATAEAGSARKARRRGCTERASASGSVDVARIALGCVRGYCEQRHRVCDWRPGQASLAARCDGIAANPSFQATLPPTGSQLGLSSGHRARMVKRASIVRPSCRSSKVKAHRGP